jgi:hypothetical protein
MGLGRAPRAKFVIPFRLSLNSSKQSSYKDESHGKSSVAFVLKFRAYFNASNFDKVIWQISASEGIRVLDSGMFCEESVFSAIDFIVLRSPISATKIVE